MRRIITWSDARQAPVDRHRRVDRRGRRPLHGPEAPERDHQRRLQAPLRRSRASAPTPCSRPRSRTPRARRSSSSTARTPALTDAQKAAITAGKAWLLERRRAHQQRQRPVLGGRQGRAALRQPRRQSGRGELPRLGAGHPRPLRRDRRGHAGARHGPRRAHHRRLQDLPERRRQAARRHRHPRARAAAGHLPLAGAAVRAADRRRLRLLRRRRHPGARRQRPSATRSPGRPPRSWSSCCSAPAPTTACC